MRVLRAIERRRVLLDISLLLGLVGGFLGCSSIEPVAPAAAPITDPTQLYMALTLDHPAVTLSTVAPYNTLQLLATPRDALDSAMAGLPAPTFRSTDTTSVTVTAAGLVTALQAAEGVQVIATLQVGPVTHADTAVINVTTLAPPPTLASLSIHPGPSDSAMWTMAVAANLSPLQVGEVVFLFPWGFSGEIGNAGFSTFVAPRVLDATGAELAGLPFAYTSLDPGVATVDRRSGLVSQIRPGQVRMVAQTTAYGITKADTATFTITLPVLDVFLMRPGPSGTRGFFPTEVRVRPYGLVAWANTVADAVDVVFDDPTNVALPPAGGCDLLPLFIVDGGFLPYFDPGSSCGMGDMVVPPHPDGSTAYAGSSVQWRQFPVPGVYPFHSARLGASGRVIVTADPNGNAPTVP